MRNPNLLWLSILALSAGLTACSDDTAPTGATLPGEGGSPDDDPALPGAITLTPTDDATIDFAAADENFGLAPILRIEAHAVALLRFDLTEVPDSLVITGAELHLMRATARPQVAGALMVMAMPTDQWQENTITWQTAPTDPAEWLGTLDLEPLPGGERRLFFVADALGERVRAEHQDDGALTLRLASPQRVAVFARESGAASARPRLELALAPRTR
jgi:hypothetical protein